jgi:tetratricopeptide (TPR) repeat protein
MVVFIAPAVWVACVFWAWMVLAVFAPNVGQAAEKKRAEKAEVDHLRLAAMLIRDGHVDRAAAVLAEVKAGKKKLDRGRYYLLKGIVAVKRKNHKKAIRALGAALKSGRRDKRIDLLLAQSYFKLKNYHRALHFLKKAQTEAQKVAAGFLLAAQCHWRLGRRVEAWKALDQGLLRHPKDSELLRQKVLLLVEMGLYIQASRLARRFLSRTACTVDDYVAMGEALHRAGQHQRAAMILEEARLRYPHDRRVLMQLARCYLKDAKPLAAAVLLQRASFLAPQLRVEAAELYRRAGRLELAGLLNSQVVDQKAKMRQKLGLLIEGGRYEQAAALLPRLARLGLLLDQQVVYALAYAFFRVGQFNVAESWLKRITQTALFEKSVALRRAISACAEKGWSCLY